MIREEKVDLTYEQVNKPMKEEMNELVDGLKACEGRGSTLFHP